MKLTTKDTEDTEREFLIIYRWIERNHPDGFIDSLSYSQNLERVTDRWYDRFDELERERDKARTELEVWRDGNIMHQIHRDELEKTERERDEARDQVEELTAVIKGLRAIMRQDATK
jgi:hypothetical protein